MTTVPIETAAKRKLREQAARAKAAQTPVAVPQPAPTPAPLGPLLGPPAPTPSFAQGLRDATGFGQGIGLPLLQGIGQGIRAMPVELGGRTIRQGQALPPPENAMQGIGQGSVGLGTGLLSPEAPQPSFGSDQPRGDSIGPLLMFSPIKGAQAIERGVQTAANVAPALKAGAKQIAKGESGFARVSKATGAKGQQPLPQTPATQPSVPAAPPPAEAAGSSPAAPGGVPPSKPPAPATAAPNMPEPDTTATIDKVRALLKAAKPSAAEQQALYTAERSKRFGAVAGIQRQMGGLPGYYKELGQLKGQLPKAVFQPAMPTLSEQEVNGLFNTINAFEDMTPGEKTSTKAGLFTLLNGALPQDAQLAKLQQVFGRPLVADILSNRSNLERLGANLIDLVNAPRILQSSMDLSMPFRQALTTTVAHPVAGTRAFVTMLRAAKSEQFFTKFQGALRQDPFFTIAHDDMGIHFHDVSGIDVKAGEEGVLKSMVGTAVSKIPGVGLSQRSAAAYLNKLRLDVAKAVTAGWGPEEFAKWGEDMGKVINAGTGRGSLGKLGEPAAQLLSTAIYAPRLIAARVQLPFYLIKGLATGAAKGEMTPVTKEAARQVGFTVAAGITLLAFGKKSGLWDVELDARSPDFGKGRVGNTRFDLWGGWQPMVRYTAQLISGEGKYPEGIVARNRWRDVFLRFVQSKFAPLPSFAADVASTSSGGKTFAGQEMGTNPKSLLDQAYQRLSGLFIQDLIDVGRDVATTGNAAWRVPAVAVGGITGVGTQTYGTAQTAAVEATNKDFQSIPGLAELGLKLGVVPTKMTVRMAGQKVDIQLNDAQQADYQTLMGSIVTPNMRRLAETVLRNPNLSDDQRKTILGNYMTQLKTRAHNTYEATLLRGSSATPSSSPTTPNVFVPPVYVPPTPVGAR